MRVCRSVAVQAKAINDVAAFAFKERDLFLVAEAATNPRYIFPGIYTEGNLARDRRMGCGGYRCVILKGRLSGTSSRRKTS